MIVRTGIFLLMALGLAAFATVAWISLRPPARATAAVVVPQKVAVLIAARPLQAGGLLRPEDLDVRTILKSNEASDANEDTPAVRGTLLGAMIRRSFGKGEPVLSSAVLRPGDHGFLAAVLGAGTRAVTVGVNAVSGSAGLIWPGDRVDLILTETDGADRNDRVRVSALRVLSNVRVIAIDQHLVEGVTAQTSTTQEQARTVTVEVAGTDAERVAVANRLGTLSLAVRSAEHGSPATDDDQPAVVRSTDILPAPPQQAPAPVQTQPVTMRIWQGINAAEFHF